MPAQYLMIGEVLKPQGVRGEVKVKPYAADASQFMKWRTVFREDGGVYSPLKCVCSRVHDGFVYLTLGDAANCDDAEKLRGVRLWIDRPHAQRLPKGEVYITDLIGCKLVDEDGTELGELTDVLQYGSVDTYVFKTPRGVMMAPALKTAFPEMDVEAGVIRACTSRLDEVSVFED